MIMAKNIRKKAGEADAQTVAKSKVARSRKAQQTDVVAGKEVIKSKNALSSKPTRTSRAKSTSSAAKKAVNISVKHVVKSKQEKISMEERLAAIKSMQDVDGGSMDEQMLLDEISASAEEKEDIFPVNKKAKKIMSAEKKEEEQKIIMWTGVVVFMVLIVAIWAYNIKSVLDVTAAGSQPLLVGSQVKTDKQPQTSNLQELKQEIKKLQQEREDLFHAATPDGQAEAQDVKTPSLESSEKGMVPTATTSQEEVPDRPVDDAPKAE